MNNQKNNAFIRNKTHVSYCTQVKSLIAPLRQLPTLLFLSFFLFTSVKDVRSQSASGMPYRFSLSTPTTAFPATATNIIPPGAPADEWTTLLNPGGGWTFDFAGVTYTQVVISSNGWLALIPSGIAVNPLPAPANSLPNNQLNNNTTGYPLIAPLWDDHSVSLVTYNVTAGVLSVRWYVKWQKTNPAAVASLFWVELNGNPGVNTIGLRYFNNAGYVATTPSASIGIAGPCPGDFYSVSVQSSSVVSNAATVDSLVENTNIGNGAANNIRPFNVNYDFTPYHPYDNCSGAYSARSLGSINTTCTNFLASTFNASPSGAGNCTTTDDNDVWFSFIKPFGSSSVTVSTSPASCRSVTGTAVEVYDACGGALLNCAFTSVANPNYGELTLTRPACSVETLYVRVTADGDIPGKFNICVKDNSGALGQTCAAAMPACAPLPFNSLSNTTAGSINNYYPLTPADPGVICQSDYLSGEDFVYAFTPTVTQCLTISIDGTGPNSYPGLFILDGCPDDTLNSHCIATATNTSNGDTIANLTYVAGQTYYIIVDNNATLAGFSSIPFNLHITAAGGAGPPNDACGSAVSLGIIPNNVACTWSAQYTTQCSTPSPVSGYPNPGCGDFQTTITNDVWFTFTPSFSGVLLINSQGAGANPVMHGGMAVYSGTCGAFTLLACSGDSVAIPFMPQLSIGVTNATIYYIRFWSSTAFDPGSFQLCFTGNCSPPNDFPVNAITLPMATPTLGDNSCSTGLQEMPTPLNCTIAPVNTVWYKLVIPNTAQYAVRISQLSLLDAAVAAFIFPTGVANAATSFTRLACNDDIIFAPPCPICGMTGDNDAAIQFNATAGSTVYLAVDGEYGWTGTFYITIIQGNLASQFPPVYRKDCATPEYICANNNYTLPNGGVGSNGNICDFQNMACSGGTTVSEVGACWLNFTVAAGSPLGFTITPNDSASPVANYNFFLWDVTGLTNFCNVITSTPPIRCNTSPGTGKTGCRNPVTPLFSNTIPAQATNRTYMLFAQNLTSANSDDNAPGTTTGFQLDWAIYTGGVISGYTNIIGTSPTSNWTGIVATTSYQHLPNWKGVGNCPPVLPTCTTDVFISAATQQCWVPVNGNSYAKNLTINPGGTLRLQPGSTMHICGDYVNNGSLIADPTSTIVFEGSTIQNISGALTGANSFANLVINKTNSTPVILNNNLDVTQNFTTNNNTSVFNINGKYMKVGGNFTNANGTTTFTGYGSSVVEFNGAINQYFTNLLGSSILNRVIMNKSAGKLYLNSVFSTMNIDSALTLTAGIISTRTLPNLEVNMKYYLPAAITGHNATSYIDGNLRRKIANPAPLSSPLIPASYDFPVGDTLTPGGYENANVTFVTSTLVFDLLANFTPWPAGPPALGPPAWECVSYTYNLLPPFNHGYWTLRRSTSTFGGNYNLSLHNTGMTNNTGTFWTVAKADLNANPSLSASWRLKGTCVPASTPGNTQRHDMNTPAADSTSFNSFYTTVQSNVQLPVELLFFGAEPTDGFVTCKWETATETNNEYFEVERSLDGITFESIGKVPGCGRGICSGNHSYSLLDTENCLGIVYYRLKQVDFDGKTNYTEVIAVDCSHAVNHLSVHPNPAHASLTLSFNEQSDGNVNVNIIDYTGRVILRKTIDAQKGMNQKQLSIEHLSDGVYYLNLQTEESGNASQRKIRFIKKSK